MSQPYQQPGVVGLPQNQFPAGLYQPYALHPQAAGINLTAPNMQLQAQSMPGSIVVSQANFQPSAGSKLPTPVKKRSGAIKIVDPDTGDVVNVGKSDNSSTNPPSSTNPTPGGGLLPEPTPKISRPDVVQDFKTKVQSTMNTSSPVFVPRQSMQPDYRPNAIIRPPVLKPPPPQEKAPIINGGKTEEEEVTPTTPLEPPPTPLEPPPTELLKPSPAAEEPIKEQPSPPIESPVTTQGAH